MKGFLVKIFLLCVALACTLGAEENVKTATNDQTENTATEDAKKSANEIPFMALNKKSSSDIPWVLASKKRNLPLFKKSKGELPLFDRSIITEEENLPLFRRRAPHHKRAFGNGGSYGWLRSHRGVSPHSLWARNERPFIWYAPHADETYQRPPGRRY
ncbi:uncharacterized protein [Clytia hemisphaerica]|uniref:uncharacterized protein n=1 Tax=Clytia hemisphaerica TaxID=252671 RepID=UPI0034D67F33